MSSLFFSLCRSAPSHSCCPLHIGSGLLFLGVTSGEAFGSPCRWFPGSWKMEPQMSSPSTSAWLSLGLCRQVHSCESVSGLCLLSLLPEKRVLGPRSHFHLQIPVLVSDREMGVAVTCSALCVGTPWVSLKSCRGTCPETLGRCTLRPCGV